MWLPPIRDPGGLGSTSSVFIGAASFGWAGMTRADKSSFEVPAHWRGSHDRHDIVLHQVPEQIEGAARVDLAEFGEASHPAALLQGGQFT